MTKGEAAGQVAAAQLHGCTHHHPPPPSPSSSTASLPLLPAAANCCLLLLPHRPSCNDVAHISMCEGMCYSHQGLCCNMSCIQPKALGAEANLHGTAQHSTEQHRARTTSSSTFSASASKRRQTPCCCGHARGQDAFQTPPSLLVLRSTCGGSHSRSATAAGTKQPCAAGNPLPGLLLPGRQRQQQWHTRGCMAHMLVCCPSCQQWCQHLAG